MQKWWLLGAGVIGVLLAVVMMGSPDTGGEVTKPVASNGGNPVDFQPDGAPAATPGTVSGSRNGRVGPMRGEDRQGNGPSAIGQQLIARRAQPDAMAAARLTGPWAAIRMHIGRIPDESQRAALQPLDEQISTIVTQVRDARRDPMAVDFDKLFTDQRALASQVRSSAIGTAPDVVTSLDTIDKIFADLDASMKEGATTPPTPPAGD